MLNNPALSDPRTVLHALNFKAAFVCLAAMFMPDCPRPVGREWLSLRTGVPSLARIGDSLKHLTNMGLVYQTVSGWYLSDGAKQLPLPFAQLRPGTQPAGRIIDAEPGSQLATRPRSQAAPNRPGASPANRSSSQLTTLPRSQGDHQPGAQLATKSYPQPTPSYPQEKVSYPQAVDNSPPPRSIAGQKQPVTQPAASGENILNGRFPEARSFCTADQDKDACLFVVNSSLKETTNKQTNKQEDASPFKTNSTRDFLTSIHMLHGVPDRFAHVPLPVVLAYWWHINTWATNNPQGSLYRRLSQGHDTPPADYLRLAQVWLGMDSEDRAELREAAGGTQNGVYHPPVANGRQFRFQLGDDFYPELDTTALDAYLYLLANAPEEVVTP